MMTGGTPISGNHHVRASMIEITLSATYQKVNDCQCLMVPWNLDKNILVFLAYKLH
jgi:hypothetical protein